MTTIVDSNLPVAARHRNHSRLESRIVHLGCGAFTARTRRCIPIICWKAPTATGASAKLT
ncbi:hypothetical protein ACLK1T_08385 [Escherichia coli]